MVDSMNWTFLAGFYAGGKSDEEVTVHRIADRGDSEGRGSRVPVAQLTRKHGISAATYYHWKSKYAGAGLAELKRLRELEAENSKLKRMYADLALENAAIKEVLNRKL
jgi:putative transposase